MDPVRILLIDDDEDDYLLTRELLGECGGTGYRLDWTASFEEGMAVIARAEHDAYLIDYRLGAHTGLELLDAARKRNRKAAMILLTGAGSREVDQAAMAAGAADYLVKSELISPMLERSIRYAIRHTHTLEALRASEERYAAAVNSANDGLWEWNLDTDEVYYSPRWKAILGYRPDELGNGLDEWLLRVHPEDRERLTADLEAHLKGVLPLLVNEHRIRHRDGHDLWVLSRGLMVRDEDGRLLPRVAGSLTDVSERKRIQEKLLYDALHDGLTGLPNRTLFMDRLQYAFESRKRHPGYRCAVLFIDLDRFKVVNDSLGHITGDRLLIYVAQRLRECLGAGNTIARLGGDEFGVFLENVESIEAVRDAAECVAGLLRQPVNLDGYEIFTTGSIGIALSDLGHAGPEDLLRDADIAMYQAKAQGRARYVVFGRDMHQRMVERMRLEHDLRRALERNELLLNYQPIVDLGNEQITGFEALARWQHPERGRVSPLEFIPVAEETGLILPLGWWVLEQACRDLKALQTRCPQQPLTVSVNVAARQFSQPDLVERVAETLARTDLDPHSLILEITESTVMEGSAIAAARLQQVRDLGVGCYIDDFGTGYSSLSYLHRFPITALKVDRSFVDNMTGSSEHRAIVQAIVVLAHTLGMAVVAEGVESAEQAGQLCRLGCEYAQGYRFAPPLDWAAAASLVEHPAQMGIH